MLLNLNFISLALMKSPREVSGGVSFLHDNRLQLCNFVHNVLSQKKQCSKLTTETLGKDVY